MKINQIGGEFALIQRLGAISKGDHPQVIQGIGDDAAVLKTGPESAPYLLVTVDTLVENRHFKRQWAGPEQIGMKAAESNVSDIAAMGGVADWMVVSLTLPSETEVHWVEGLYRGLAECCRSHGMALVGGDTTQGPVVTISITLIGHVMSQDLCLRSDAKIGDRLMTTGLLGAPAAAMALLDKGLKPSVYLMDKLVSPRCRMDIAGTLAPLANAMIDISDGLAAETRHICTQSRLGAEIIAAKIGFHPEVLAAADRLGCDPLAWALGGGEDYELLFTISAKNYTALRKTGLECHEMGRITSVTAGTVLVHPDGRRTALEGGYDHFSAVDFHS